MKKTTKNVCAFLSTATLCFGCVSQSVTQEIAFTSVQESLFSDAYGQSNAFADYDNDGDLDLAVVFLNRPIRLYENRGVEGFINVAVQRDLMAPNGNARSIAWGDIDNDGDLDLYIGYADRVNPNQLFENQLSQGLSEFVSVGEEKGVAMVGLTRQLNFIDFDGDGDLDLHVAVRNASNRLYQNEGGDFTNVATSVGLYEPRRTVGACWFDMDGDGDLDAFTANQSGDRDGMYKNKDGRFSDVAIQLNMDQARRPLRDGGVGCAVTDFDNDGDLDLYVAEYGDDSLFRNDGNGQFTDVAREMGVAVHDHIVTGVWGDINNDGDLDLALAANDPAGSHFLFRNDLAFPSESIKIQVVDANGSYVMAGTEVRVFVAGSDKLLGLRMLDTGSGYNSQNSKPVHIATGTHLEVDIEIKAMTHSNQTKRLSGVRVSDLNNETLTIRME